MKAAIWTHLLDLIDGFSLQKIAKVQRHNKKSEKGKYVVLHYDGSYLNWVMFFMAGHIKFKHKFGKKKLLSRFIKKFQRKTELAVFSQWTHFAYESKTQRSRVQRFLKKYKYKVEISAFDSWVDFTEEMKTQRSRVNKFLKKYKYRTEIAAFSRWAECAPGEKEVQGFGP